MTITLTREEAQQVLDALECMNEGAINAEIKLLRARLSAPEPGEKKYTEESCPVCGYYCLGKGGVNCIDKPKLCGINTAPPQRKWQGLTLKDMMQLCASDVDEATLDFARAIEAKLKEKNG